MNKKVVWKKGDIPKLRYGMIHSQVGFSDGVSIVMEQVESVLKQNLNVPQKNIFYLVGKAAKRNSRITEREVLWDRNKVNQRMVSRFESGYGGRLNESIEMSIWRARKIIEEWVIKNKIDVIIAHNSSHPVNFISSIALSRFYRDFKSKRRVAPKYIVWWHDSHLERDHFKSPASDVENYLLEGVPGRFVDYIVFINKLQFEAAEKYFKRIDKRYPGFYKKIASNYNVTYNTTDVFINSFRDLKRLKSIRMDGFIEDFKIRELFKKNNLKLNEVLFCLQHTRVVERKRIDFALRYCYKLLEKAKSSDFKAIYFFVSGENCERGLRQKLERLNDKLRIKYGTKLFLVFKEDEKTNLAFEEYPRIFAKLGGFSTYFSEVEGFGNNLLEVLASGLIPIIYKYPVFRKDIERYNFELLALDNFEIRDEDLRETLKIVKSRRERKKMVEKNLKILKKHFTHSVIAIKLKQAILK